METKLTPIVKIAKVEPYVKGIPLPSYQTPGSAGMDLMSQANVVIPRNGWVVVRTGISVEIPLGYEGQVRSRSGLASKFAVSVLNSPGTVDSDYRGEVKVILFNAGMDDYEINTGDRIAQLVICPVEQVLLCEVDSLSDTKRGQGGFGSTGA